jgi:hypothetical protein
MRSTQEESDDRPLLAPQAARLMGSGSHAIDLDGS